MRKRALFFPMSILAGVSLLLGIGLLAHDVSTATREAPASGAAPDWQGSVGGSEETPASGAASEGQGPATGGEEVPAKTAATLVVATGDSSARAKGQADYIGDGIDDDVEIERAISDLPAYGGVVYLSEGNYSGGQILIQRDNVSIMANGGALYRVKDGTNAAAFVLGGSDTKTYSNIKVRGLKIDGNYVNQKQPTFKGIVQATAILAYKVSGFWIEDNYVYDAYQHAINVEKSHNGVISGNYAENQGDDAIGTSEDAYDITIVGNTVKVGRYVTGSSSGVEIEDGSYRITVSGNTITGTVADSYGIIVKHHPGEPHSHDITIVGNTIYQVKNGEGIAVLNDDGGWVDWDRNIVIAYNIIRGTTDFTLDRRGINVRWAENVVVSRNVIYGFRRGIVANEARGVIITENIVDSPAREGIWAGEDQLIENNMVRNADIPYRKGRE